MGLTITRKVGESFHIGDYIVVTVTGLNQREIRLTVEAPQNLKILRTELIGAADCLWCGKPKMRPCLTADESEVCEWR